MSSRPAETSPWKSFHRQAGAHAIAALLLVYGVAVGDLLFRTTEPISQTGLYLFRYAVICGSMLWVPFCGMWCLATLVFQREALGRALASPSPASEVLDRESRRAGNRANIACSHLIAGPVFWYLVALPSWLRAATLRDQVFSPAHFESPSTLSLFLLTWLPPSLLWAISSVSFWRKIRRQEAAYPAPDP